VDDFYFMKTALDLALKGQGFTSPNPMVGAVVVKNRKVVGKGFHEAAGKAHAEVNAIDAAGKNAQGATLYVTLEPCNHTGRTPPCTKKILAAGIKRVVFAMSDPNPDVDGGGKDYLISCGVDVTSGVCEDAAARQNEAFLKYIKTKRPFVIVKCASTLDGRIATRTGDSRWVTNSRSRKYVHRLRQACDGIMVGINTVKTDNPSLTTRLDGIKCRDPIRVILDTNLSIDEDARVLQLTSDSDTIIVTSPSAPEDKKLRLEEKGARVVKSQLKDGWIDMDYLMGSLGTNGITSLLIEGGGRVIASAFHAKIVDKINFFYGARILGGDDGIPVCQGPGPKLMKASISVKNVKVRQFGDDVMVEGYIAC